MEISELNKYYNNGEVVIQTFAGKIVGPMSDFIEHDVDSMLYELNRLEEVILADKDNKRFINDYATCKVIRALKQKINELENNV